MKLSQVCFLIFMMALSFNGYSQYGTIDLKNGDQLVMIEPDLLVEGESLRYFKETYKPKASVMGIGYKKEKKRMQSKTGLVKFSEIERINAQGELKAGSKSILEFNGIRFVKLKRGYRRFYIIEEGECTLLAKPESGNALFSFFVQKGNEEPFKLHQVGTAIGAKFKKKSRKYFADCAPAMDYIKNDLKRSTLAKLVQIYNESCAK